MKKLPTINIKGKEYTTVAERIIYFNETYKNGSIVTKLLTPVESELIVIHAIIYPDITNKDRNFHGHSQEKIGEGYINKTSALENAETSAVGRALGMMGIGVIESVASSDEINKATANTVKKSDNQDKFTCSLCKSDMKISPKSGKPYCPNWKEHKANGEYGQPIKFDPSLKGLENEVDEFLKDAGEK